MAVKSSTDKMMPHNHFIGAIYAVDDRVVYPGHGVARINRIIEQAVGKDKVHFYELKFLNKEMTVLVPMANLSSVGIRPLSSHDHVTDVFKLLEQPPKEISPFELTASNWNKRNKDYQIKIRKGDLLELSKIYRDLKNIARQKELSFGEKTLLHQTEMLLVEEISIVQHVEEEKALSLLRSTFNNLIKVPTSQHHRAKTI